MANQQVGSLDAPNQVLNMEHGRIDIVHIAGAGVGSRDVRTGVEVVGA